MSSSEAQELGQVLRLQAEQMKVLTVLRDMLFRLVQQARGRE
jgi:hypothetical protein